LGFRLFPNPPNLDYNISSPLMHVCIADVYSFVHWDANYLPRPN